MPILIRKKSIQHLDATQVYKIDTNNFIFQVSNIPVIFPIGKSYFLLKGSDELQNLSEIEIEIIDADGNPVFYDIVSTVESTSRVISVWVQNDTAIGTAKLTLVGKSKNVPDTWFNIKNVKYQTNLYLDKNIPNENQIKFEFDPTIIATEFVRKYVNFETNKLSNLEFTGGTISGKNISSLTTQYNNDIKVLPYEVTISPGYEILSNMIYPQLYINQVTGYYRVGGKIKYETIYNYTSSIFNINNSHNFTVTTPPTTSLGTILNFDNTSGYKIVYENNATGSSTIYTSSYLELDVKNIVPFSGEVETLRVYKNILNSEITDQHLGDYLIQDYELLNVDTSLEKINIGNFKIPNTLRYWLTSSVYNEIYISSSVALNNSYVFGAVELMTQPIDNIFKFYSSVNINSKINEEYTLSFNCATSIDNRLSEQSWNVNRGIYYVGEIVYDGMKSYICILEHNPNPANETEPNYGVNWINYWILVNNITTSIPISIVDLYVSGSAVNPTNSYGKKIGTITSSTVKNYGNLNFNVITDRSGSFTPVFVINSGKWYISNISFKYASDIGYNPSSTKIYIPNTSNKRNDYSKFKVQFLNSKNDISYTQIQTNTIKIVNNPTYIELDDNILSGSMFIGTEVNSGIEMAGKGSGYVRSLGYRGYTTATQGSTPAGFIIYSGSRNLSTVLSSSDNYEGVGIELNAGANYGRMRFKADYTKSIFEVIADSFYVGSPSTQYISGSGGLIEISSSNFLLSSSGDVYVHGAIFADTGSFGGFTITSHSIKSVNLFISGSPGIGNGYSASSNMFISTSNFNVKGNGDITGSKVLFTGGQIGGLTIGDYNLHTGYINITASLSQTDPSTLISSSVFNNVNNFVILNQGAPSGSSIVTLNGIDYLKLQVADGSIQDPERAEASGSVIGGLLYTTEFDVFLSGSDSGSIVNKPFPLNISMYENGVFKYQKSITFTMSSNGGIIVSPSSVSIKYIPISTSNLTVRLEFGLLQQFLFSAQAFISNFHITYYSPKVEMSERGLIVATSPTDYIKINVDENEFTNLNANNINVNNVLNRSGSHYLYIKPYSPSDYIYMGFNNNLRLYGTGSNFNLNVYDGKLTFGSTFGQVNLYRSGFNILKTDDNLITDGYLIVSGTLNVTGSSSVSDLTIRNNVSSYNGLTTYGQGVPPIIYSTSSFGVVSGINTNITTISGLYRITIYYSVDTVNLGGGTVYSTVTYENPMSTSHVLTGTTLNTTAGIGSYYSYSYNIYHMGTNNLNITLTTAGLGTGGTIMYAVSVERLI